MIFAVFAPRSSPGRAGRRAALVALLSTCLLCTASAGAQTVDLSKSRIAFGFKQENVPGEGHFRKFSAQVAFDAAKPEAIRASVEIETASVDLGDANWNNDIQGASWFATRAHPRASFVVAGAKALGGNRFEAPARLTLKGATRDVVATFSARADGAATIIEGSVPLKRIDFKIGEGAWADTGVVANEVAVRFRVHLVK